MFAGNPSDTECALAPITLVLWINHGARPIATLPSKDHPQPIDACRAVENTSRMRYDLEESSFDGTRPITG